MPMLYPSALKAQARQKVRSTRTDTKKLVLIYCAVFAVLSLGSNGLQMFLDSQIDATGGLSGLQTRTILETIQEIMSYINTFFSPFWTAGFLFAMMGVARDRDSGPKSLGEGFRRFGRVLGHTAFELLVTIMVATAVIYLACFLFSFTHWGAQFVEALLPVLEDPNLFTADGSVNLDLVPPEAIRLLLPMGVIFAVIFVALYVYLTYCFRLSMYLVMDDGYMGGTRAHFVSMKLMRGHKWQMLKLDLSYWWYYALGTLISVVGYLDVVLALYGVTVPIDAMVMYFGTLILYFVLQLALYLWKKCEVDTAYALAFDAIAHPAAEEQAISTETE